MSSYFNPTPLIVVNGDTAEASDLNLYGTSLDSSFDLVEADINDVNQNAELWAGVAEQWAQDPEDVEVEPGEYSSLHWSAKSEGHANDSSTYATNSLNSSSASSSSASSAQAAQTAAELAETNADTAQTAAELAETNASISETNAGISETNAATSEDNSELSYWESEASRQTSDNYAVTVEDTFVDVVTSDGDGSYTSTPTTDYSSLHWATKAAASTLPAGTKMIFYQASAPVGWTQDTTHNNKMLRVVSGSGGGSGGSDSPILMDKVPIHTHSASTNTTGSHTHSIANYVSSGAGQRAPFNNSPVSSQQTGSAGNHSHTVTVNDNSGSDWTPLYVDLIICTKD